MECDSAALSATSRRSFYARQLCAVASEDFRDIQPRARVLQLGDLQEIKYPAPKRFGTRSWGKPPDALYKTLRERPKVTVGHFIISKCLITCQARSDYWQLLIISKELVHAVRLLSPKADFLRSNVTLFTNTALSKEFQGESR